MGLPDDFSPATYLPSVLMPGVRTLFLSMLEKKEKRKMSVKMMIIMVVETLN